MKGESKRHIFIGLDLGGTTIKLALIDGEKIVVTHKIISKAGQSFKTQLPKIKLTIDNLLKTQGISPHKLGGIGLAFPSIVDNQKKRILSQYVKFSDADQIDLVKWTREGWGIPFAIENDARAALVGEWQFGAGKGSNHLVMITLGTGVGSGVILDGKLVRGAHHVGGNLGGHTIINMHGSRCNCGSHGCVETEASGWVVHQKYQGHPRLPDSELSEEKQIDYKSVFTLAEKGDDLARDIREHALKAWAVNALNFVHHFDPEILILGGGIMHSGKYIIPYIQAFIDQYAWQPSGTIKVMKAKQIDFAGALGMGYLAQTTIRS